jgi:hypothetical protein
MGGECSRYGERRGTYRVLVGKPEKKKPLGRLGLHGSIILKWSFKKWNGRHGLD